MLPENDAAAIPGARLCRGYETEREAVSISYAALGILKAHRSRYGLRWSWKMAHLTGDKYRITPRTSPSDYRFGRAHGKPAGFPALGRVNGYFRNMIEAVAKAKLRRMQRELDRGGIGFARAQSRPAGHARASK